MMSSIVRSQLQQFLSEFIEDGYDIQVNSGGFILENLVVKADAIIPSSLPIYLVSGFIRRMEVEIPFRSLGSSPVVTRVNDVILLLKMKKVMNWTKEEELSRYRQEKLEAASWVWGEAPLQEKLDEFLKLYTSDTKNAGYKAQFVQRLVDNMHLHVENVHIRFEDNLSVANYAVNQLSEPDGEEKCHSIGLQISRVESFAADSSWSEAFLDHDAQTLRRAVHLEAVSVYCDPYSPCLVKRSEQSGRTCTISNSEILRRLKGIESTAMKAAAKTNQWWDTPISVNMHHFLISPLQKVSLNVSHTADDSDHAVEGFSASRNTSVEVTCDPIAASIDTDQVAALCYLLQQIKAYTAWQRSIRSRYYSTLLSSITDEESLEFQSLVRKKATTSGGKLSNADQKRLLELQESFPVHRLATLRQQSIAQESMDCVEPKEYTVVFEEGPLGMDIEVNSEKYGHNGLTVNNCLPGGQAASSGTIKSGFIVTKIGFVNIEHMEYKQALNLLRTTSRPLPMTFRSYPRESMFTPSLNTQSSAVGQQSISLSVSFDSYSVSFVSGSIRREIFRAIGGQCFSHFTLKLGPTGVLHSLDGSIQNREIEICDRWNPTPSFLSQRIFSIEPFHVERKSKPTSNRSFGIDVSFDLPLLSTTGSSVAGSSSKTTIISYEENHSSNTSRIFSNRKNSTSSTSAAQESTTSSQPATHTNPHMQVSIGSVEICLPVKQMEWIGWIVETQWNEIQQHLRQLRRQQRDIISDEEKLQRMNSKLFFNAASAVHARDSVSISSDEGRNSGLGIKSNEQSPASVRNSEFEPESFVTHGTSQQDTQERGQTSTEEDEEGELLQKIMFQHGFSLKSARRSSYIDSELVPSTFAGVFGSLVTIPTVLGDDESSMFHYSVAMKLFILKFMTESREELIQCQHQRELGQGRTSDTSIHSDALLLFGMAVRNARTKLKIHGRQRTVQLLEQSIDASFAYSREMSAVRGVHDESVSRPLFLMGTMLPGYDPCTFETDLAFLRQWKGGTGKKASSPQFFVRLERLEGTQPTTCKDTEEKTLAALSCDLHVCCTQLHSLEMLKSSQQMLCDLSPSSIYLSLIPFVLPAASNLPWQPSTPTSNSGQTQTQTQGFGCSRLPFCHVSVVAEDVVVLTERFEDIPLTTEDRDKRIGAFQINSRVEYSFDDAKQDESCVVDVGGVFFGLIHPSTSSNGSSSSSTGTQSEERALKRVQMVYKRGVRRDTRPTPCFAVKQLGHEDEEKSTAKPLLAVDGYRNIHKHFTWKVLPSSTLHKLLSQFCEEIQLNWPSTGFALDDCASSSTQRSDGPKSAIRSHKESLPGALPCFLQELAVAAPGAGLSAHGSSRFDITALLRALQLSLVQFGSERERSFLPSIVASETDLSTASAKKPVQSVHLHGSTWTEHALRGTLEHNQHSLQKVVLEDTCFHSKGSLPVPTLETFQCKHLVHLSLTNASITDDALAYIFHIAPGLQTVLLNSIRRLSLMSLHNSFPRKLRELTVRNCRQVEEIGLENMLAQCQEIRSLDISKNKHLKNVKFQLPALNKLSVAFCSQLTDECVNELLRMNPRVSDLDLAWCYQLKDVTLKTASLRSINLYRCGHIKVASINQLFEQNAELQSLNLTGYKRVKTRMELEYPKERTDILHQMIRKWKLSRMKVREEIPTLMFSSLSLRSIVLEENNDLTDDELTLLCTRCVYLEELNVNFCSKLENAMVSGSYLKLVSATYCTRLTTHAVESMIKSCPKLRSLNVMGCREVNLRSVDTETYGDLRVFDVGTADGRDTSTTGGSTLPQQSSASVSSSVVKSQ